MIIYNTNHTVEFSIYKKYPELLCVCSTRALGHLNVGIKPIENAAKLLNLYHISLTDFVSQRQGHGDHISIVNQSYGYQIIQDNDGLITQEKNMYLGVKFADCVPVFYYDPVQQIVAVVHSGWKGTLVKIAEKMVRHLISLGSKTQDIRVAIGPHICGKCYEIGEEVKVQFFNQYPKNPEILFMLNNRWHVDLGFAIKKMLIDAGINIQSIDMPEVCTACNNDKFYSFRKDKKNEHGEMLGIIGIRENIGG